MQQLILNVGTGETSVVETPVPCLRDGHVLVRTHCTLVSAGTERMLVDFGRASLIEKARQQPDKVRMVLDKMRTDGIAATLDATRSKLDQPLALGYCNVGTVMDLGRGVAQLHVGDRVVSNGNHASVVSVPKNLCAVVPENVEDESALFTVLGAIGLQGLRLAQPTIGETIVVTGLGVIGLLTVQLLRAHGCRVMAIDLDQQRLELASGFGAYAVDAADGHELVSRAMEFSRHRGVDAVIITASTRSSEPVSLAAQMCRKRGRIVLVGVTGLELSRQDFYDKELSFQVSCSYGPGRYDESYEQRGQDYPVGYVRWTEQRNFEAVLDLMSSGALNLERLVTHRYPIDRAKEAYTVLTGSEPSLGIVLEYSRKTTEEPGAKTIALGRGRSIEPAKPVIGCVGAGNYGGRVLLPALARSGAQCHTLVTNNGASVVHYGKKFDFAKASTNIDELFENSEINTVVIATRHDSHAALTARALRSGRHVYVEKPLALTLEELAEVEGTYLESTRNGKSPILMVGFNRRFSPHVLLMKEALRQMEAPKSLTMLINAGTIPLKHWTQDPEVGGGRLIGEGCHFVDLARFLVGARIANVKASPMRDGSGAQDTATISLEFEDGSLASIQYYANGNRSFPKERVEVFASGRILQLENFRKVSGFGWPSFRGRRTWTQDKGHTKCVEKFLQAVESGGPPPIPPEEIFEVSRVSIEVAAQLRLQ